MAASPRCSPRTCAHHPINHQGGKPVLHHLGVLAELHLHQTIAYWPAVRPSVNASYTGSTDVEPLVPHAWQVFELARPDKAAQQRLKADYDKNVEQQEQRVL